MTGLTCRGDSGGPLVEFNSEEEYYVQVGIVTGGACQSESEPAVFARIEDNLNFEFITKEFWDHMSPTAAKSTTTTTARTTSLTSNTTGMATSMPKT